MNPYLSKFCFKYQYNSKPKNNLTIFDSIHMIFYTRFPYPSLSVPESSTVAAYGILATALLKSSMAPPKTRNFFIYNVGLFCVNYHFGPCITLSYNSYLQGIECCPRILRHILYHIMI